MGGKTMTDAAEVLAEARQFQKARVILTAAELDVFGGLQAEPGTAAELAARLGLDPRATARLLDCLVGFGLLAKAEGCYRTTEAASLLASAHPESLRPLLLHMSHIWRNWSHLTEAVRRGANPDRQKATEGRETLEAFIGAMHANARTLAAEVALAYDAGRFERLLDIGGGSGTYTIALLRRNPRLAAVLFDLPDVIAMARERLQAEGLQDRVRLVPGDFYADELPPGCDLALLSAIIHQNSPGQNLALFRKVHRALAAGGALLIRDHVMDEDRTHPPGGALFALNMLVGTDGGDTYTFAEVGRALAEAGFGEVRLVRRGERMDGLVEALKPASSG
jgi:SAM-dependent methyltransferase